MSGEPVKFSSKLTTVLVAAGCSVGLGNIWRFPYIAGEGGGAAFVILYILCIILIGHPVMIAEFAVGRQAHRSAVGAYRFLGGKKWSILGYNGVLTAFIIMGFYYVVAGWTAEYFTMSVTGELANATSPDEYKSLFVNFISHPWKPVLFTWIFIAVNHVIIDLGVAKGLERVSKVLMPLLFIILIVMAINSMTLPNSWDGVLFFLKPDFSKITPAVILTAVGQMFFTLSIGLGALVAYGSYIPKDADLRKTATQVTILDTSVAIIAGLIIFPAAASVGISPDSGPALVFQTLPAIFNSLPFSMLWASVFFLLLIIAALTSTMSLHEVVTVYLMEEWHVTRRVGTYITSASICALSAVASLSLGEWSGFTIFGMTLFDFMDYVTANIMLPIGGLVTSVFVGWYLDRKIFEGQLTNDGKIKAGDLQLNRFLLRYLCPIALFVMFVNNLGLF